MCVGGGGGGGWKGVLVCVLFLGVSVWVMAWGGSVCLGGECVCVRINVCECVCECVCVCEYLSCNFSLVTRGEGR